MTLLKDEKVTVSDQHELGYKMLTVGQPIAGKDIPKATYISCINLFAPMSLIDLLSKHKIVTTIKILNDFPIDANRNRFVQEAIDSKSDYLFFMDMDMTFPPDTLTNLFEIVSDEKPVVSGMYFLKQEPYAPVMGRYSNWDKATEPFRKEFEATGMVHPNGDLLSSFRPFTYFDIKGNPFKADVIGMGCVLIKSEVFKKLSMPYFRYTVDPRPGFGHKTMSEDMYFCAQLAKAGIPIYIDPRVQCGHITAIQSTVELYMQYREAQFEAVKRINENRYNEIMSQIIDVRGEQNVNPVAEVVSIGGESGAVS